MKGKIGLVVGLGAGYVLGTRAGRERYEQIKTQWLKLWHLDPVQKQVVRVQEIAKAQAAAVPGALWTGAVKVVKAVSNAGTAEQRFNSGVDAVKQAAGDVVDAASDATARGVEQADTTTAATQPAASRPAARKSTAKASGAAKKTTSEAE
ncbi:hypothetical protein Q9R19_10530 [Microbacterium sp. ARD32]|uniref:hypothetical protein n=1 Tax=Microbacterium sp. ARD32 TaxID=2962577 RepID=UPI002881F6DE|nr:hypothetical protein [Microbacterium sp. ARD32]MDT0158058.1 hypothetical protein [Microbacterium sp. ARD32]